MNEITVGEARRIFEPQSEFEQWESWFDAHSDEPIADALRGACDGGLRWGCHVLGIVPAWEQYEAVARPAWEQYETVARPAMEQYRAVARPAMEQYRAVERPALEQYRAVARPAMEQYRAVERPAWEQYEAVERPAWEHLINAVCSAVVAKMEGAGEQ